jgi:hypothetical protein
MLITAINKPNFMNIEISWIKKRFGKYRRNLWNDMENMDEMWNDMENMEEK